MAQDLSILDGKLIHRGPDGVGFLTWRPDIGASVTTTPQEGVSSRVGFVHRRLAIIDVGETGAQPMISANGNFAITYNGEVYNYLEVRAELEREGVIFRTRSDTEVVLEAWSRWGKACLTRFTGMFAFTILDLQERRVFLARDPFGIKPLYVTRTARGDLAFASEIPALLALSGVARKVCPERLADYLATGASDRGGRTMIASINSLRPGTFATVSLDADLAIEEEVYWKISRREQKAHSAHDAVAELREIFLRNIRLHLRSDVPVGAALSGGVDSSSIVAAMRQIGGEGLEIHAFSFASSEEATNEERYARLVAERMDAVLHITDGNEGRLNEDLDALIRSQGEPFASTSIQAQSAVYRLVRERGIKVTLDGQGADEMFAGYPIFRAARLAALLRSGQLRRALFLAQALGGGELIRSISLLMPEGLQEYLRERRGGGSWLDSKWLAKHRTTPPELRRTKRGLLHDTLESTLLDTSIPALLRYGDRNSMSASVESRVPFLTTEFVEAALSLPEELLVGDDGETKRAFREAMRGITPNEVLDRRDKIGFVTPQEKWLAIARGWVDDVKSGQGYASLPLTNRNIDRAPAPFQWRVLNAARWMDIFELEL
ncbi:MAG: asparagine synthase (glutamine-hydrolyzing) [Roseicyclus sp.]|uniref:asparagine synthase (glutamine-hydrolyzing) n=1 Tax=Roseicyclus sp. TaxID=1914329 RepID=UPI003A8B21FE